MRRMFSSCRTLGSTRSTLVAQSGSFKHTSPYDLRSAPPAQGYARFDRDGWAVLLVRVGRSLRPYSTVIAGTLRRDADVGFTTCRRGHRHVVRRVGRALAPLR